jgi:hypothetical protein
VIQIDFEHLVVTYDQQKSRFLSADYD